MVSSAFEDLTEAVQNRLSAPFGGVEKDLSIFEAVRAFAAVLLEKNPHFAQSIKNSCPGFFDAADFEVIMEMNRLSSGSELTALALERAKDVFLKHIARPFNLHQIVDLFKRHQNVCAPDKDEIRPYIKCIIVICLEKARAIDIGQRALHWFREGRRKDREDDAAWFDARYKCYEFLFEFLNDVQGFERMLSSNDELFHICLYHRLFSEGATHKLFGLKTPYIEPFLEEFCPGQLWEYWRKRADYEKSALALYHSFESSTGSVGEKIEMLRRLIPMAAAAGLQDLKEKSSLMITCGEIQIELDRGGDALISHRELFTLCCEEGRWDLVLKLLAIAPVSTDNRDKLFSKVWANLLAEQLWNEDLSVCQRRIMDTVKLIDQTTEVKNPLIVMPILEEHRLRKDGHELWGVETMIMCGMDTDLILRSYLNALECKDLSEDRRCEFIYCAAVVIEKGGNPKGRNIGEMKDWFIEHARRCRYFQAAFRVISKL
jgi:hypothetical protein